MAKVKSAWLFSAQAPLQIAVILGVLLYFYPMQTLGAEEVVTFTKTGSMEVGNLDSPGYWIVEPRDPLWASWTTYDFMIRVDSLGRVAWFRPSIELISSTPKIQPPEAVEIAARKKNMAAPPRIAIDYSQSKNQKKLYHIESTDPRMKGVEDVPMALDGMTDDFRKKEIETTGMALDLLPEDSRSQGIESLEEAARAKQQIMNSDNSASSESLENKGKSSQTKP